MESLGYQSFKANPPENGVKYHSYLLCYVMTFHNTDSMLKWLHKSFPLNLGFGNLDMYLGTKLHKMRLHNGVGA